MHVCVCVWEEINADKWNWSYRKQGGERVWACVWKLLTHPGKPCSFLKPRLTQLPDLKQKKKRSSQSNCLSGISPSIFTFPLPCWLPVLFPSSPTSEKDHSRGKSRKRDCWKWTAVLLQNKRSRQVTFQCLLSFPASSLSWISSLCFSQTCKQQQFTHKATIKRNSSPLFRWGRTGEVEHWVERRGGGVGIHIPVLALKLKLHFAGK